MQYLAYVDVFQSDIPGGGAHHCSAELIACIALIRCALLGGQDTVESLGGGFLTLSIFALINGSGAPAVLYTGRRLVPFFDGI